MYHTIIISVLVSFVITLALGPVVLPLLRRLKFGQTVREEGVKAHIKKTGTPTMGGVMFLIGITITALIFMREYPNVIPVLILTLGFGVIGFIDDYLKVVKKNSDGLKPLQKFILQILVTGAFAYYILQISGISLEILLPYTGGRTIQLGWFAIVILFLAVLGTVNGTNFTDGLDGLASSVTVIVAVFLTVASVVRSAGIDPLTAAVVGSLLAFLVYNVYPAKVFMGDTGSLALGGFVVGSAYMMQMPIFVIIIGLVYVVEVASVMIQVTYFKRTGGKRFFKMAPIHHHFELCGWSETRIVNVFSTVTIILCLIAFLGM